MHAGGEVMTAEGRLRSTVSLQVPDRVPACPFIRYFSAFCTGTTVNEPWSEPGRYSPGPDPSGPSNPAGGTV